MFCQLVSASLVHADQNQSLLQAFHKIVIIYRKVADFVTYYFVGISAQNVSGRCA